MLAVNGQFPDKVVVIWVRQQPVSNLRKLACSQLQKDHCREVAELIRNLKDSKFKRGERRLIFFAYKPTNPHVELAKKEKKAGRWDAVVVMRPRKNTGGKNIEFGAQQTAI